MVIVSSAKRKIAWLSCFLEEHVNQPWAEILIEPGTSSTNLLNFVDISPDQQIFLQVGETSFALATLSQQTFPQNRTFCQPHETSTGIAFAGKHWQFAEHQPLMDQNGGNYNP